MWVQKLGAGVSAVAFAPDGRTLYVADRGGAVTAWDTAAHTRTPVFKLAKDDPRPFQRLLPAADGRHLVALAGDTLLARDLVAGVERARLHLPLVHELVLLPDPEPRLVHVAPDRTQLNAWSPTRGEVGRFAGPLPEAVWSYTLSPDGRLGAAVCGPNVGPLLFDPATGAERAKFAVPPGEYLGMVRVKFTPDGRLAMFFLRGFQLWDVARVEPVGPVLPLSGRNWDTTFAFHPTSPVFAAVSPDGHPALFSLDTGEQLRAFDLALGTWAMCLTFSPDGLTCAVGGSNKQFVVFDVDV